MLPLCYAAPMEMKDRESRRGKRREKKSLTQDKLHRELSGKLVRQESNPGPQPLQQARYPNVTTAAQKQKLKLTRDARFPIWGKKFSSDDDMPGSTSNTTLAFASFSHSLPLSVPLSLSLSLLFFNSLNLVHSLPFSLFLSLQQNCSFVKAYSIRTVSFSFQCLIGRRDPGFNSCYPQNFFKGNSYYKWS